MPVLIAIILVLDYCDIRRKILVSSRTWPRFSRVDFMGPEEKYQYWLNDARNDMDVAESMFAAGHWVYVLFMYQHMCQQSIEKLAKGLFGLYFHFNTIPFNHNIDRLLEPIADKLLLNIPQETWDFFGELSKYAVNKRYPDYYPFN
jgi:HEPN domain-containing protein